MAAYTEAAAAWVAAGIVPLPLGGEDGKRPLIRHPARLGPRAAIEIANKPRFACAPGEARLIARKYNVPLPLARVVAELVATTEARR